jgi:hypothetical protein
VTNRNKITKNAAKLKCNNEKMHERIKQDKRMNAGGSPVLFMMES